MPLLLGCEDLVDTEYPSNQIGRVQVFEDIQTANAALAGLYASLRDRYVLKTNYGLGPLLDSYTDNLKCFLDDQNGVMDIYNDSPQATNSTIETIWNNAYEEIYYANSIIYGAEHSTELSQEEKDGIIGEALFVRSLVYFYLQQLFGDIPYTTSLDYEHNQSLNKIGANIVLEQLELDLSEAIDLLSNEYRDAERIYPNKKVAELLLAKLYLTGHKYELAQQKLTNILQFSFYQFQEDINEVFHKSGNHILWQLKPANNGDPTQEAAFYYFTNSAPNSYVLTQDLIDIFDDNDLRKQVYMEKVVFNDDSWYRPNKYKNRANNTNEYSIVFRLAEVSGLMAEALAGQNKFNEALPYLNVTRVRAGLPPIASLSDEGFANELLKEKRREFFTEFGQRFLDLKRFKRLDQLSGMKPNWTTNNDLWPLPQTELLLNSNLAPQNEGY